MLERLALRLASRLRDSVDLGAPPGGCEKHEDGSAVITISRPPETPGEPHRLVRIAIRVKEQTTDGQAIEAANPHAA